MYYLYVLKSLKTGKRYVGSTSKDPHERLKEHNEGMARFTKGNRPWILAYEEKYDSFTEARKRENFLKSGVGRQLLDTMLKKE